jgi:hypothetical protein
VPHIAHWEAMAPRARVCELTGQHGRHVLICESHFSSALARGTFDIISDYGPIMNKFAQPGSSMLLLVRVLLNPDLLKDSPR